MLKGSSNPISHLYANLLPSCLKPKQVDEYATKHELKIVGMYTAPSTNMNLAADSNITQAVAKVADKIKQFYSDAFIFVVRNTVAMDGLAIVVFSPPKFRSNLQPLCSPSPHRSTIPSPKAPRLLLLDLCTSQVLTAAGELSLVKASRRLLPSLKFCKSPSVFTSIAICATLTAPWTIPRRTGQTLPSSPSPSKIEPSSCLHLPPYCIKSKSCTGPDEFIRMAHNFTFFGVPFLLPPVDVLARGSVMKGENHELGYAVCSVL